jgi:hypothetical protein
MRRVAGTLEKSANVSPGRALRGAAREYSNDGRFVDILPRSPHSKPSEADGFPVGMTGRAEVHSSSTGKRALRLRSGQANGRFMIALILTLWLIAAVPPSARSRDEQAGDDRRRRGHGVRPMRSTGESRTPSATCTRRRSMTWNATTFSCWIPVASGRRFFRREIFDRRQAADVFD